MREKRKYRLNSTPSVRHMSGWNEANLSEKHMSVGLVFARRYLTLKVCWSHTNWESSQKLGDNKCRQMLAIEHTCDQVHDSPFGPCSIEPGQRSSGLRTGLWLSSSGHILTPTMERPEDDSSLTLQIQSDKAWENRPQKMGYTGQTLCAKLVDKAYAQDTLPVLCVYDTTSLIYSLHGVIERSISFLWKLNLINLQTWIKFSRN